MPEHQTAKIIRTKECPYRKSCKNKLQHKSNNKFLIVILSANSFGAGTWTNDPKNPGITPYSPYSTKKPGDSPGLLLTCICYPINLQT